MQPETWKPPITTGTLGGAELAREIECAGILIGLHADQSDEAGAGPADLTDRTLHVDDGVALVAGIDLDIDVRSKHALLGASASSA